MQIEMKMVLFAIFLLLINPLSKIINKDSFKRQINFYLLGGASFASVLYIFFSAPDFRFGEAYIWLFFAVVISLYADYLVRENKGFKIVVVLIATYLIFLVSWPIWIDSQPIWRSVRWDPTLPVEKVLVVPDDGSPSFNAFKPKEGDWCGNSELPCTPEQAIFDGKVKELVPGDISKGFAPVK
jgi:uncharacterized MnhB-related membrane protein